MKLAVHISFFNRNKNKTDRWANADEKFPYLKKIIEEYNYYPMGVDIFIHTNKLFDVNHINYSPYKNGKVSIIQHNLFKYFIFKGKNYYLTWACRKLLSLQKNQYDFFLYQEDDIFIPKNTIIYWLNNKDKCLKNNSNLGFLRIEMKDGEEYVSDLTEKLTKEKYLGENKYIVNDINPYCAFWIYDKKEFNRWIESDLYDLKRVHGYEALVSRKLEKIGLNKYPRLRYLIYSYKNKRPDSAMEASAIGINGLRINWYTNTLIPFKDGYLDKDCKVFHLSNYYANEEDTAMGSIKFKDILNLN